MLKPQILRNRLQKKGMKKLRKYFFLLAIILGGLLISAGWRFEGIPSKLIVIAGIIAIIKGLILIKAKAADKMVEWLGAQPLMLFRIGGCFWILTGIIILTLH